MSAAPAAFATVTPATINAGGGTFVNPLMQTWVQGFSDYTAGAVNINYAAVGSTAGQNGLNSGLYAFAGSDAPEAQSKWSTALCEPACGTLLQFPWTLGGVALFYNIPGVTTSLKLTGPVIADIYLQKITWWNASAITSLNPTVNASLLADPIVCVHRSDGSGTTYALTTYFTRVSTDWNASGLGAATSVNWPNTPNPELGGSGSGGVAALVVSTPYSIGYADSYYALSNKLLSASVLNSAGAYLQPTIATIAAAAAADAALVEANPTYSITNAPGASSYPISTFTYGLVFENQSNQGVGNDLAQFFWWVLTSGQGQGPALNYPALPANVVTISENIIAQMNYQGTPFITISAASVTCTPASLKVGLTSKCTATVSGGAKGGVVFWAASGGGKFSNVACLLNKNLQCKVVFATGQAPTETVVASYLGDGGAGGFSGEFAITVAQSVSKTALTCTPKAVAGLGDTTVCKASVTGYYPSGTVTFSQSSVVGTGTVSFSSLTCVLGTPTKTTSSCSVTLTGTNVGKDQIIASYGGDTNNVASTKTHNLTIK